MPIFAFIDNLFKSNFLIFKFRIMRTNKLFIFKVFALFCLSAVLLTSCGQPKEAPDQVIQKFKQQVTDIKSADISAEIAMNGTDQQDTIDFTAGVNFKFDRRDTEARKADVKVTVSGMMKTADASLDGDLDVSLRSVDDNYYLKLDKLESTAEAMKKIEPVIKGYIGNWEHISNDFIPESVKKLQQKDEATLLREKQLKDLFVNTNLFTVTKEYGVENVTGHKAYHYGIKLNEDGVKEYIRKAAIIDGRELTDADVQESSKIASYVENAELWVGVNDYYLYKAVVSLTGGATDPASDMGLNITMQGADYNKAVDIEAPKDAAELNPLEVIMALSAASTPATTDGSATATGDGAAQPTEGVTTDEGTQPTEGTTTEGATGGTTTDDTTGGTPTEGTAQ